MMPTIPADIQDHKSLRTTVYIFYAFKFTIVCVDHEIAVLIDLCNAVSMHVIVGSVQKIYTIVPSTYLMQHTDNHFGASPEHLSLCCLVIKFSHNYYHIIRTEFLG